MPSDAEWQTLVDYLGGNAVAGGKMKETEPHIGAAPILEPPTKAVFPRCPAATVAAMGLMYDMGNYAYFWSSTENDSNDAWYRSLSYIIQKSSGITLQLCKTVSRFVVLRINLVPFYHLT